MPTILEFYDRKTKQKIRKEVKEVQEVQGKRYAFTTTEDGRRISKALRKDQRIDI